MTKRDEFTERTLNILNFDLEKIDVSKIQYVHMNNFCYSTKYRPNLFTFNLQTCVALYLYGKDFTFLAHINTTEKNVSELFFNQYSKKFILLNFLLENILCRNYWNIYKNDEQFYTGLVYVCTPYPKDRIIIKSINDGINNMILQASKMGININRLEDKNLPEFVLDFDSKEFITPSTKKYIK